MSNLHFYSLQVYGFFIGVAALLSLLSRRQYSPAKRGSIQQKAPIYILINIIFLTAVWLPQDWHSFSILLALICALASWEVTSALGVDTPLRWGLPVIGAGLVLGADLIQPTAFIKSWLLVFLTIGASSALVTPAARLGRTLLGILACLGYLPLCLSAYIWLWHKDSGAFYAVFVYLTVAANDTFAQLTGQLLGRHPLVPHISPNKTIEGALGGILAAAVIGCALSLTIGWSYTDGALLGAAIALLGLIGDVSESAWKRALGVKDFSALLGANGGVLDRFDALIFVVPIVYLVLFW